MGLAERKAIDISIEKWERIVRGEAHKEVMKDLDTKYGGMFADCALCEYSIGKPSSDCTACPYRWKFGRCLADISPYELWCLAETPEDERKYASQFLAQLEEL